MKLQTRFNVLHWALVKVVKSSKLPIMTFHLRATQKKDLEWYKQVTLVDISKWHWSCLYIVLISRYKQLAQVDMSKWHCTKFPDFIPQCPHPLVPSLVLFPFLQHSGAACPYTQWVATASNYMSDTSLACLAPPTQIKWLSSSFCASLALNWIADELSWDPFVIYIIWAFHRQEQWGFGSKKY